MARNSYEKSCGDDNTKIATDFEIYGKLLREVIKITSTPEKDEEAQRMVI